MVEKTPRLRASARKKICVICGKKSLWFVVFLPFKAILKSMFAFYGDFISDYYLVLKSRFARRKEFSPAGSICLA